MQQKCVTNCKFQRYLLFLIVWIKRFRNKRSLTSKQTLIFCCSCYWTVAIVVLLSWVYITHRLSCYKSQENWTPKEFSTPTKLLFKGTLSRLPENSDQQRFLMFHSRSGSLGRKFVWAFILLLLVLCIFSKLTSLYSVSHFPKDYGWLS